ncbi:TPA: response regulator transcription factor [Photobacterium damselae]
MRILLVEDHHDIAGIIFDYFEIKGAVLDHAATGPRGLALAKEQHYDLIILDLMLPKMDGLTVCRELRDYGIDTPVLMLTAMDGIEDILAGFQNGADDYLVKPFDLEILEARVKALTRRRSGMVASNTLVFGELSLDVKTHTAYRKSCKFALNPSLFTILRLLMTRAPQVVTKDELVTALWGDDEPDSNVLRSHLYQLRNLIDKPFEHAYIQTLPKVGYQLVTPEVSHED